jgi:hypothetical protein
MKHLIQVHQQHQRHHHIESAPHGRPLIAAHLKLDAKSKSDFINGGVLPVGIKDLPKYLSSDATTKKDLVTKTEGIAVDTSNAPSNELKDWIMNARRANSKASVVVKADAKAPYAVIRKVMKTLQNQGVDRFSLLTTMGAKD